MLTSEQYEIDINAIPHITIGPDCDPDTISARYNARILELAEQVANLQQTDNHTLPPGVELEGGVLTVSRYYNGQVNQVLRIDIPERTTTRIGYSISQLEYWACVLEDFIT